MSKNSLELIRTVVEKSIRSKTFAAKAFEKVKIVSAADGKCKAEFTVSDDHLNFGGSLHGGFTATLLDVISTYALMTKPASPGVSVDIHVSYLKAAFPGDLVTVDAKTVKAGKTLAFLDVEITKDNGKVVIAKGSHTKFIGGS